MAKRLWCGTSLIVTMALWVSSPAVGYAADAPAARKAQLAKEKSSAAKSAPRAVPAPSAKPAGASRRALRKTNSAPVASPAPRAQQSGTSADGKPAFIPVAATTGGLGLFTMENGELLPKKGFGGSVFVNKFGRQPGCLTILNVGWSFAYGFHDRFNAFVQMEPHRHLHVGNPAQLSVLTPLANPQFGTTMYRGLLPVGGAAPGYAEDFPYANRNSRGFGEVILGARFAVAQERLGASVNFSVGYDFFIPTKNGLPELLDNQVQQGTFGHGPAWSLSRTWNEWFATSFGGSFRFTRNADTLGVRRFESADQLRFGLGLHVLPQKRFQLINEYNALVFTGASTQNTTFGARDPIDGIWGVRYYIGRWTNVALDAGYRRMLNLSDHRDRNGFVFKLAATHWMAAPPPAPPPNREPLVSCSANPLGVQAGSRQTVRVEIRANDPDGDTLTYRWSASGGRIEGTAAQTDWNAGEAPPGLYTVTGTARDSKGATATCSVSIRVEPRPNRPPMLMCNTAQRSYLAGERAPISGRASDPDGDALTYTWRASAGQVISRGENVQLDTSGLEAGAYSVTGRVEDGRGGAADCSVAINIQTPPPRPQATKINECSFRASSARVDNVCKRILDDAALRLQGDTRAQIVVIGLSDPGEPKNIADKRAAGVRDYLASKGISGARVVTREASGKAGAGKQNRRVDLVWVPPGAMY